MIETLQQLGHNVCAQLHELSFYFSDALIPSLQQVFASQSFDCIFTFNFIPPVSNVAEAIQIPYLCWVYDCPHVTLYSNSLRNRCNYIFSVLTGRCSRMHYCTARFTLITCHSP